MQDLAPASCPIAVFAYIVMVAMTHDPLQFID